MRTLLDQHPNAQKAEARLILLAPALSTLEDLVSQGFVAAVRQRKLPLDILLVQIDPQQVLAGTVAEDLQQLIRPENSAGQQKTWLAGISLGGFCALHYAARFARQLNGLTLIAPYPGTTDILNEISQAGGVQAWQADPSSSSADERFWWKWLCRQQQAPEPLQIHLGLGLQDRFAAGQALMADLMPAGQMDRIDGDHSWPVWHTLWQRWLNRLALDLSPGAPH